MGAQNNKASDLIKKAFDESSSYAKFTGDTVVFNGESAAYANKLLQYPGGVASVVSDSYDIFNAVYNIWGEELKPLVQLRGDTGLLVIRPDSGTPVITCMRILVLLHLRFKDHLDDSAFTGYKKYKGIKVLQGDGVNEISVTNILNAMTYGTGDWEGKKVYYVEKGKKTEFSSFKDVIQMSFEEEKQTPQSEVLNRFFSEDHIGETMASLGEIKWDPRCIFFGMGGALLQILNRDTQRWAMKCSYIILKDGTMRDVTKDPITDQGKKSKTGELQLYQSGSGLDTKFYFSTTGSDKKTMYGTVDETGKVDSDTLVSPPYFDGKALLNPVYKKESGSHVEFRKIDFEQIIANSNKDLGELEETLNEKMKA